MIKRWWNAEPKSGFARYAYGLTDQKPHWTEWLIIVALIAVDVAWFYYRYLQDGPK